MLHAEGGIFGLGHTYRPCTETRWQCTYLWGLQDVPEHRMPAADDLFTQLNEGEKFTKLDLSSAYQQVLLDEESRQYVTINTHLGLYRYTRLPFGVPQVLPYFRR